jgi:hypothetical protein
MSTAVKTTVIAGTSAPAKTMTTPGTQGMPTAISGTPAKAASQADMPIRRTVAVSLSLKIQNRMNN